MYAIISLLIFVLLLYTLFLDVDKRKNPDASSCRNPSYYPCLYPFAKLGINFETAKSFLQNLPFLIDLGQERQEYVMS